MVLPVLRRRLDVQGAGEVLAGINGGLIDCDALVAVDSICRGRVEPRGVPVRWVARPAVRSVRSGLVERCLAGVLECERNCCLLTRRERCRRVGLAHELRRIIRRRPRVVIGICRRQRHPDLVVSVVKHPGLVLGDGGEVFMRRSRCRRRLDRDRAGECLTGSDRCLIDRDALVTDHARSRSVYPLRVPVYRITGSAVRRIRSCVVERCRPGVLVRKLDRAGLPRGDRAVGVVLADERRRVIGRRPRHMVGVSGRQGRPDVVVPVVEHPRLVLSHGREVLP